MWELIEEKGLAMTSGFRWFLPIVLIASPVVADEYDPQWEMALATHLYAVAKHCSPFYEIDVEWVSMRGGLAMTTSGSTDGEFLNQAFEYEKLWYDLDRQVGLANPNYEWEVEQLQKGWCEDQRDYLLGQGMALAFPTE